MEFKYDYKIFCDSNDINEFNFGINIFVKIVGILVFFVAIIMSYHFYFSNNNSIFIFL